MKKSEKQKIGLYGGTFNPIHFGHINLAIEIKEKKGLDQVWFIPTSLNPLKISDSLPVSGNDRLEMVRLAIQDIPSFSVKDLEIHRGTPAYTIDTLHQLIKDQDHNQYFLLLGQDTIEGFFQWKLVNEIVATIPLLIGTRTGNWKDPHPAEHDPNIVAAIHKGLVKTRNLDISSTDLRTRLSQGLYCEHLLPKKVLDYIVKRRLYQKNPT